MEKNIGEIIREVRKNRGMTLTDLSEGIMSFSSLAEFERGKYVISFDKLIKLLKKLNLSFTEFGFLIKENSDFYKWWNEILLLFEKEDLKKIFYYEKILRKNAASIQEKCNLIMLNNLISIKYDKNHPSESEINFLIDYFWKCGIWTHYDLLLFGNTSNLLSSKSIEVFSNEIIKKINSLFENGYRYEDYIRTIMNNIDILWSRNKYETCEKLINKINPYIKKTSYLELTFTKVFKNLINYKKIKM